MKTNSHVTYLTRPQVLRRTEAAYAWVTPTRLRPSTSIIWSFTCILTHIQTDIQTDNKTDTYKQTDRLLTRQ